MPIYAIPSDRFVTVGRLFFALALIGFGIQQYIFGDFVPGRAPAWPPSIPGRLVWAYVSGALLIAAGAAIISGKKARCAAILAGTMIFLWALLRHLPALVANPHGITLTNTGKALVLFGGAFAVAGSLPATEGRLAGALSRFINSQDGFIYLGRFCLSAFMILAGIQHFQFVQFVVTLVPAWIPGHLFWTYFSAVALIAGGAGLLLPQTSRLAAALSGSMIFLWVLMLHIPRALAAPAVQTRNECIAVFEALAFSGIALVLTKSLSNAIHNRER